MINFEKHSCWVRISTGNNIGIQFILSTLSLPPSFPLFPVWMNAHATACVVGGQPEEISSPLPPCGAWGSSSGCQLGGKHLSPQSLLASPLMLNIFYFIFICIGVLPACIAVPSAQRGLKRASDTETELETVVSQRVWGIKHRSYVRTSALNL